MVFLFGILIVLTLYFISEPTIYLIIKKSGKTDSVTYEVMNMLFGKKRTIKLYYMAGLLSLAGTLAFYFVFIAEML